MNGNYGFFPSNHATLLLNLIPGAEPIKEIDSPKVKVEEKKVEPVVVVEPAKQSVASLIKKTESVLPAKTPVQPNILKKTTSSPIQKSESASPANTSTQPTQPVLSKIGSTPTISNTILSTVSAMSNDDKRQSIAGNSKKQAVADMDSIKIDIAASIKLREDLESRISSLLKVVQDLQQARITLPVSKNSSSNTIELQNSIGVLQSEIQTLSSKNILVQQNLQTAKEEVQSIESKIKLQRIENEKLSKEIAQTQETVNSISKRTTNISPPGGNMRPTNSSSTPNPNPNPNPNSGQSRRVPPNLPKKPAELSVPPNPNPNQAAVPLGKGPTASKVIRRPAPSMPPMNRRPSPGTNPKPSFAPARPSIPTPNTRPSPSTTPKPMAPGPNTVPKSTNIRTPSPVETQANNPIGRNSSPQRSLSVNYSKPRPPGAGGPRLIRKP